MKTQNYAALLLGLTGAALTFSLPPAARAADHERVEEGIPVQMEDVYPIPYLGREVQGYVTYDDTRDGKSLTVLQPRLEYGFARNWQAKLSVPYRVGNSPETAGSGNTAAEVFYNFNTESLTLPAFAVSVQEAFPTARGHAGIESRVKLIAAKTLGPGDHLDRLYLNLDYYNQSAPAADQRSNRYEAIAGYSRRLGLDTILVTDFDRRQEQFKGKNANVIELGIRRQFTPQTLYAVGAGVGEDSPKFRVTFGFQHSF